MFRNDGKSNLEKLGIKQASTFFGFCSIHDKSLFSCVEDRPFIGDEDQCFALMYRSVAKELYAKDGVVFTSEFFKNIDKGKSFADQVLIQQFVGVNKLGAEISIKEIKNFKTMLADQLLGNSTNIMSHLIIEFSSPIPIAVSSLTAPSFDFEGRLIQDLWDLDVVAEYLVFNSFSKDGIGYVTFSWLKNSNKIFDFINTLLPKKKTDMFSALVRFFFGVAENIFISPAWWNELSALQKNKIESLIMVGVPPTADISGSFMNNDGAEFPGWEIYAIKKVNF